MVSKWLLQMQKGREVFETPRPFIRV